MDKFRLLPLGLFSAFIIKLLVLGASFSDAAVALVLAGLVAALEYRIGKPFEDKVEARFKELEVLLDANKRQADDVKTSLMGIKLNNNIRSSR